MKILFYLILLLSIFSCNRQTKNIEQKAIDDTFLNIVDSTLIDRRTYIGFDYSKKQIDSIRKDTISRIVAIRNEMTGIHEYDLKEIPTKFKISDDLISRINAEKYNSQKYKFKDLSTLPFEESFDNWANKYKTFSGVLEFSHIYFDENLNNGVLTVTYSCNIRCSVTYLVYILKDENKWKIKKVQKIGIS